MEKKFYLENVVYQIYPRSFCDSNGDGIGDINGIISKLDYLQDLGVGILWLSPVYKSPLDDIGYDVSDYMDIHPDYGTLADMDNLISEAKKRGMRIVMDLVVNHTSDEHAWFIASKDINSPYHKFYYWRKGRANNKKPPNNWDSMFSGSAWKYDKDIDMWYLHLYGEKQVDLDYHNEEVIQEVEKILKFWLDRGVYGFRCDVINQIYKTSLANGRKRLYMTGKEHYLNQPGNHLILKRFYDDIFSKYDCFTVGETYNIDINETKKFVDHELTMCFNFEHLNLDRAKIPVFKKKYRPATLKKVIKKWQENLDWNTNVFENHDQHRSIERFGSLDYYEESGKMLAMLLLTLRGTPYIYQGEEIGMADNSYASLDEINDISAHKVYAQIKKIFPFFSEKKIMEMVDLNNRDHSRTPMQWDDSMYGGFSTSKPWIKDNPVDCQRTNVKKALADPTSLFHFYKELIRIRKDNPVLSYGKIRFLPANKNVLAYYRYDNNDSFLVVVNLAKKKIKNAFYEDGEIVLSSYQRKDLLSSDYLMPYECYLVKCK